MQLIYFAVRPALQGAGVGHKMIQPVLDYADEHGLLISLETHNPANLPRYNHYGFDVYKTLKSHFELTQYCLVRQPGAPLRPKAPAAPQKGM